MGTSATVTSTTTTTKTRTTAPLAESLFCFSLMLPWGYEPSLLRIQLKERMSIFDCDETAVYSNKVIHLGFNVETNVVDKNLHSPIGGEFHTALNTPIFIAVWKQLIKDGRFRYHGWTVKTDPDAVFLPSRLRRVIRGPHSLRAA